MLGCWGITLRRRPCQPISFHTISPTFFCSVPICSSPMKSIDFRLQIYLTQIQKNCEEEFEYLLATQGHQEHRKLVPELRPSDLRVCKQHELQILGIKHNLSFDICFFLLFFVLILQLDSLSSKHASYCYVTPKSENLYFPVSYQYYVIYSVYKKQYNFRMYPVSQSLLSFYHTTHRDENVARVRLNAIEEMI